MRKTRFFRSGLLSWVVVWLLASEALAQAYPAKPIRVLDGFAPGGSTDIVARMIAPKFQESQGQPWVVENRSGAQGMIAAEVVSKAPPDGYTLVMVTATHAIHPSIYKGMPYDFTKAFAPVMQTSAIANVLVVHPSVPARTVKELIALAKAKPGRFNFAAGGTGPQMTAELFNTMTGVKMTYVGYKGGAPAVLAVATGEVDLVFGTMPTVVPHIQTGRVLPLAVCTAKRSIVLPKLPTIAEAGVPGFEATNWVGILVPAGTPREIIARLHQEIARILGMPDIRERLLVLGIEPGLSTPDQFGEYIRAEVAKWAKVVKATGMAPLAL